MDLVKLRSIILSRPIVKALAEAGQDSVVASTLNSEQVTKVFRIHRTKALRWLAMGRRAKLDAALTSPNPLVLSMAQSAIDAVLSAPDYITVDNDFIGMLAYLVGQGVLDSSDSASFIQTASELVPLTIFELGSEVLADHVSDALANDRGKDGFAKLPNE